MPQPGWSKKRERQYEHVKEGLLERGEDRDTAEEIAARTANEARARGTSDSERFQHSDRESRGRDAIVDLSSQLCG
jgi:hypothetical protein